MVYQRRKPGPKPKPKGRQPCTFDGCEKLNFGHGLCHAHYMQQRRGVPLRKIRPPKPEAGEGLLWCGKCRLFRDEDEFGWDTARNQPKRTCRPCAAVVQTGYNNRNREKVNQQVRLRKRGMTQGDYDEMLAAQDGLCAVCKQVPPRDIDHCHVGGQVRGLLCAGCNKGLGFFEDDPDRLLAAVAYLGLHGRSPS